MIEPFSSSGELGGNPLATTPAAMPVESPLWPTELGRLTRRERQVLGLLARGLGCDQAGRLLGISTHTVRTHVQNAMRKLGVRSRLEAVSAAHRGGLVGTPTPEASATPSAEEGADERRDALRRCSRLTKREGQVLALLVEGHGHQGIAERLFVSPHTSRTHIQRLIDKLGVHSRVQAAALAIRYDLVAPPEAVKRLERPAG